jgi:hypothetical protein
MQTVNPFKQVSIVFSDLFDPVVQKMYVASEQLCRDNDAVIGYHILYPLAIAAEKTKRPPVWQYSSPQTSSVRAMCPLRVYLTSERV